MNVVHLMADLHCGEDTELVLYMNPGELLSRTFTSKDTHSAAGELLVMYTEVGGCVGVGRLAARSCTVFPPKTHYSICCTGVFEAISLAPLKY